MKNFRGRRTKILGLVAVLLALVGWMRWNPDPPSPPPDPVGVLSSPVPEFTFTDQKGKPYGFKDLKGKVWIADMIYTRCPGIASPMTANMVRLQERLKKEGLAVQLVSFSIDPLYDSPAVLERYGKNLRADFGNWKFLTTSSEPVMHRFLQTAFGSPISRKTEVGEEGEPLISHSSRFYLVDGRGKVISAYNGIQPDYGQIIRDVRSVQ